MKQTPQKSSLPATFRNKHTDNMHKFIKHLHEREDRCLCLLKDLNRIVRRNAEMLHSIEKTIKEDFDCDENNSNLSYSNFVCEVCSSGLQK